MMGWGARKAAQSGAVSALAGGRSTSSRPHIQGSVASFGEHCRLISACTRNGRQRGARWASCSGYAGGQVGMSNLLKFSF